MRGALALLALVACSKPARPAEEPVVENDAPAQDTATPPASGLCEPLLAIVETPPDDTEAPINGDAPSSVQLDGAGTCALESWVFRCRASYPDDEADAVFAKLLDSLTRCLSGDAWSIGDASEDPTQYWTTPGTWVGLHAEMVGDEVEVVLEVEAEGEHDL